MSNSKAILTADNEPKRGEKPEKRDTEEDNREEKGELINNQNGHSKKTTTPDGDIDDPDFPNTAPVAPPIVEKDIYSSQSKTAVTKPIENAENLADTVIIERNGVEVRAVQILSGGGERAFLYRRRRRAAVRRSFSAAA